MLLVEHLPPESATKSLVRDSLTPAQLALLAEQAPDGHGSWSHLEMLMAHLADQLGWVIHAVYASQGGKPHEPKPYPRPGVMRAKDKPQDPRATGYLDSLRAPKQI